jgi:hypothetical protein
MSSYARTDAGQHGRNAGDIIDTSLVVSEYDLQDERSAAAEYFPTKRVAAFGREKAIIDIKEVKG